MRRIIKTINFIAAAVLCISAASCKKDNTIQYNNVTMGNIVEGRFVSDQGNTFNVVEQNCPGKIDTMGRALVICDVLTKSEGGYENEYNVRLNAMTKVLTKDIVTLGTEVGEDILHEDPVHVEYLWISGGYINMYVMFPYRPSSKTDHMINLVQTEAKEGYCFRVTHNAFGETMTDETSSEFILGGGYVSFPINTLMSEDEAKIRIEWKWYKAAGNGLSQTTEYKFTEGLYKKDGYEHAPTALVGKTRISMK